jgi:hypothetical protein
MSVGSDGLLAWIVRHSAASVLRCKVLERFSFALSRGGDSRIGLLLIQR